MIILAFSLVVLITLSGAVLAVTQGGMVRAIMGLALALGGVALAFLMLGSPFVAAMQVLIYIGGITIAMVFAVMLSPAAREDDATAPRRRLIATLAAAMFFVGVGWMLLGAEFDVSGAAGAMDLSAAAAAEGADGADAAEVNADAWSVPELGRNLLNRFNIAFETLSAVLLLAIVGAIAIAHREDDGGDPAAMDVSPDAAAPAEGDNA